MPAFAEPYALQAEETARSVAAPLVTRGQDVAADLLALADAKVGGHTHSTDYQYIAWLLCQKGMRWEPSEAEAPAAAAPATAQASWQLPTAPIARLMTRLMPLTPPPTPPRAAAG